jgi:membrane protein
VSSVAAPEREAERPSKLERLRARFPWLDHTVRAGTRYTERHGDHYAAAITFFSVLSLVPLVMIAFAVAGYVLFFNPPLLDEVRTSLTENVPPPLAPTVTGIVDQAIAQRGAVGALGLLGALYSGIGWMSNLREALSEQWAQVSAVPPIHKRLLFDLLALAGLGLALVGSFAVTTGFAAVVLGLVGLGDEAWARVLLGLIGIVLGLVANWLIFLWVIARLPREHVTLRSAAKAALLGAVGFEVLKLIMRFYLGSVTGSPSGVIFGPFLGLLVFAFFTSRFVLFVTAWAATARENEQEEPVPAPEPPVLHSEVVMQKGPTGTAALTLLGAGVLTGVLGGRLLTTRRR